VESSSEQEARSTKQRRTKYNSSGGRATNDNSTPAVRCVALIMQSGSCGLGRCEKRRGGGGMLLCSPYKITHFPHITYQASSIQASNHHASKHQTSVGGNRLVFGRADVHIVACQLQSVMSTHHLRGQIKSPAPRLIIPPQPPRSVVDIGLDLGFLSHMFFCSCGRYERLSTVSCLFN
jgi:hypothetical protein